MRREVQHPVSRRRAARSTAAICDQTSGYRRSPNRAPIHARFRHLAYLALKGSRLTLSDLREIYRTSSYVGYTYTSISDSGTEMTRVVTLYIPPAQQQQITAYVGHLGLFPE